MHIKENVFHLRLTLLILFIVAKEYLEKNYKILCSETQVVSLILEVNHKHDRTMFILG